jgi:hypothetical protein
MGLDMSSSVLRALTAERIERLKLSFSSSRAAFWDQAKNRLAHAGEYGVFRERAVQELLRLYTPGEFGIGTGFVITSQGSVSTQCDLIVFDSSKTPKIVTDSHQAFFPVECVLAVCEVKSDISSAQELNGHLDKLSKIKKLKEEIPYPSPYRSYKNKPFEPRDNAFDQMFTFLICNKLKFSPDASCISYSDSTEPRFQHNAVISIDDGGFFYCTGADGPPNFYYPTTGSKVHKHKWVSMSNEPIPRHFGLFLASYYNAMNLATLLEPDMSIYLSDHLYHGQ